MPWSRRPDWVLTDGWMDLQGHPIHLSQVYDTCAPAQQHIDFQGAFTACTHVHGWQMLITYQPANRFALFAGIETAIFAVLGLALIERFAESCGNRGVSSVLEPAVGVLGRDGRQGGGQRLQQVVARPRPRESEWVSGRAAWS
jgi:hypothetical protein